LRSDLEQLLLDGGALLRTAPVVALFQVLLSESERPSADIARARDRFFAAHMAEARAILQRASARSELRPGADPDALVELVIGAALLRSLFMGKALDAESISAIVTRAEAALRTP
jgi:hypothetical protein